MFLWPFSRWSEQVWIKPFINPEIGFKYSNQHFIYHKTHDVICYDSYTCTRIYLKYQSVEREIKPENASWIIWNWTGDGEELKHGDNIS